MFQCLLALVRQALFEGNFHLLKLRPRQVLLIINNLLFACLQMTDNLSQPKAGSAGTLTTAIRDWFIRLCFREKLKIETVTILQC